jgi:hypothetical protein
MKASLTRRFDDYSKYLHGQLSYHGFFVFLADRFLKPGGRVAFVVPTTLLRLRGARGVRQLLADRYVVDYIITAFQRAAFSEDAKFREVLLLARKTRPTDGAVTKIAYLSKLPSNSADAVEFGELITSDSPGNDAVHIEEVPYSEFRSNVRNQFLYVATSDWRLIRIWRQLLKQSGGVLRPFARLLKKQNASLLSSLRIEKETRVSTPSTFIVRRADGSSATGDRWYFQTDRKGAIVATAGKSVDRVQIPVTATARGLRRSSHVPTLDVSDRLDRIVVKPFEDLGSLIPGPRSQVRSELKAWEGKVTDRLSNLSLFRRFNLSASGTSHLAFYSSAPYAATDINLSVVGLTNEVAQFFAGWYDSSFNVLQILLERVETEGSYLETPVFVTEEFAVLDPDSVDKAARSGLIDFVAKRGQEPQPSILEQLEKGCDWRDDLDLRVASALGMSSRDSEKLVAELHSRLAVEIRQLKALMSGHAGGATEEAEVDDE